MKRLIIDTYRKIFCRKGIYALNLHIYKLALRGIGILNSEGEKVSGEKYFFENIFPRLKIKTAFDVGANRGRYCLLSKKYFPEAQVFAFEPHPENFEKLRSSLGESEINIFNFGFSDKAGSTKLWDFSDESLYKNSNLASLNRQVIESLHGGKSKFYMIKLSTIDGFCAKNKIKSIDFLKVDTEGSEFVVLKGAEKLISGGKIGVILFEFNEMNVYTRTFFRDFLELLKNYNIYRLVTDGLIPIENYQPKIHEIFAFQNCLAIHKNIHLNLG